jgi:hypothetical protein
VGTRHYHVGSNTPGYLPEGDVYQVSTKREAMAALADEARSYRAEQWDLPRYDRRTASGSAKDGYIHFSRPGDAYDLGLSFWWNECQDDCTEEAW